MSANDHLNWRQLSMFMPAGEILATHDLGDSHPSMPPEKLLARRQRQNKEFGLDKSVAAEGVHAPITIDHVPEDYNMRPAVDDGHHRLVAAMAANPRMEVPLQHIDQTNYARIDRYAEHGGTYAQYLQHHGRERSD